MHLVRLSVVEPGTAFELPDIRYFVLADSAPAGSSPPRPLRLSGPEDGARLGGDTRFAWAAAEGASAYQLEVYAQPEEPADTEPDDALQPRAPVAALSQDLLVGRFVAGIALPAEQHDVELSAVQWDSLEAGRRYRWRVRAIARDGVVVAESPVREFVVPPR